MEEEKKDNNCFICGTNSKDRVLLEAIHEDEKKLVCVRCLPPLIHGGS